MLVKEVMTPHVVSIAPEESAALAARLLARHGLGALPVCSAEGMLRGIVTLGNLAQCGRYKMEISRAPTDISAVVQKVFGWTKRFN